MYKTLTRCAAMHNLQVLKAITRYFDIMYSEVQNVDYFYYIYV